MTLKIPPPLVGLVSGAGMWLCFRLVPDLNASFVYLNYIALVFVALGLFVEFLSVFLFIQKKTTINPLAPERSTTLVVSGLYRFSRNPMYVGMLLLLIGFCLWLGNPIGFVMLIFFVWYLTKFQIKPEETALLEKFGDPYKDYLRNVGRWI